MTAGSDGHCGRLGYGGVGGLPPQGRGAVLMCGYRRVGATSHDGVAAERLARYPFVPPAVSPVTKFFCTR